MLIYSKINAGAMTVAELIKQLQKLPQDALVMHQGGEHREDYRYIRNIDYEQRGHLGREANSVVLS